MKKTTFYSLFVIFSLFLLVVFSVNAKNENEGKSQQIEQERGAKATDSAQRGGPKATDSAVLAEKCTKITSKIDAKINRYNSNADHPRLLKLQTRLSALITKLKTGGYDTATLEADLATLKTKTDSCKTAYGQFIAKLGATKNFACGQSQGQFKAALEAGKTQMKSAQTSCKNARSFINTVIKPDLKALKEKVKANRQLTPKPTRVPSPSIIPSI